VLALELKNLAKTYRGKKYKKVLALNQLNLDIPSGEVFGFIGPNGAGKSTTIKLVMGLIKADSGDIQIFGTSYNNPAARMRIGYLPENPSFYDFMTAREYLLFVGKLFKMSDANINKQLILYSKWSAFQMRLTAQYAATARAWYNAWVWHKCYYMILIYIFLMNL
jgi:ABC-2 type transport system ATP-binding protein